MVTADREQAGGEGRVDHGDQNAAALNDIADQLVGGTVGDVDKVACRGHGDGARLSRRQGSQWRPWDRREPQVRSWFREPG